MKQKTWKVNNKRYTCKVTEDGYDFASHKSRVSYSLQCGREIIFTGNDLLCSPLHDPESKETILSLMGFLTLQAGDTDSEYFDNYTGAQLAFRDSSDCELLQFLCIEEEERMSKRERRS